jgi:lysophospholipase L1-like esterase
MPHLILLGDSIFDNASYVPDRPAVEDQVRQALPPGWKVTLLAVDGHTTRDVAAQLTRLAPDASHLFVSVGGNDALGASWIFGQTIHSVDAALRLLEEIRIEFTEKYRAMLHAVKSTGKPVIVCTIYDQVPNLGPAERASLACFNEAILREAVAARVSVIDLRLLCDQPSDYSHVSPIEPSATGGFKIARVISKIATSAPDAREASIIFA